MGFSSMSLSSSSVPAFFFSFSAAAAVVVAAYMRTVGAYQSGCRVLSDEDHVPLSLAVVNTCRCITGTKWETLEVGVAFKKKKGVKSRKNTIILR